MPHGYCGGCYADNEVIGYRKFDTQVQSEVSYEVAFGTVVDATCGLRLRGF